MRQKLENHNSLSPVVLGHEKAPQDNPRRLVEMERAKRLELIRVLLEALNREISYFGHLSADALGDALDANAAAADAEGAQ